VNTAWNLRYRYILWAGTNNNFVECGKGFIKIMKVQVLYLNCNYGQKSTDKLTSTRVQRGCAHTSPSLFFAVKLQEGM